RRYRCSQWPHPGKYLRYGNRRHARSVAALARNVTGNVGKLARPRAFQFAITRRFISDSITMQSSVTWNRFPLAIAGTPSLTWRSTLVGIMGTSMSTIIAVLLVPDDPTAPG